MARASIGRIGGANGQVIAVQVTERSRGDRRPTTTAPAAPSPSERSCPGGTGAGRQPIGRRRPLRLQSGGHRTPRGRRLTTEASSAGEAGRSPALTRNRRPSPPRATASRSTCPGCGSIRRGLRDGSPGRQGCCLLESGPSLGPHHERRHLRAVHRSHHHHRDPVARVGPGSSSSSACSSWPPPPGRSGPSSPTREASSMTKPRPPPAGWPASSPIRPPTGRTSDPGSSPTSPSASPPPMPKPRPPMPRWAPSPTRVRPTSANRAPPRQGRWASWCWPSRLATKTRRPSSWGATSRPSCAVC